MYIIAFNVVASMYISYREEYTGRPQDLNVFATFSMMFSYSVEAYYPLKGLELLTSCCLGIYLVMREMNGLNQ